LGWIFSHRKNKSIFGYHLVVLAWTNGEITIPITWRVYKKGGTTKPDIGYELIRFAYYQLGIRPKAYLFDSLYASAKILKFLNSRNQIFHTQVPKNRILDDKQLKYHNKGRPRWKEIGRIKGGLEVQVIKNLKKYFITNDIGILRKEQLSTYSIRWRIEEIFRFIKSELGFEKCECRSLRSQNNHFGLCFVLFGILQVISKKT